MWNHATKAKGTCQPEKSRGFIQQPFTKSYTEDFSLINS